MDEKKNLLQIYQQMVVSGKLKKDAAQKHLVSKFYELQQSLQMRELSNTSGFFNKLFSSGAAKLSIKGLYIYGGVGRGKSMLMDLFYDTLSASSKRRVHFHAFIVEVHQVMHAWRESNKDNPDAVDPILPLARKIANESELLCFDEFQVADIADAMILGRLFTELFNQDVVVVATSNIKPEELYMDGLQRESFLPFIELLTQHVTVYELAASQDYRLSQIKALETVYYTPIDVGADAFMNKIFNSLTCGAACETTIIKTGTRELVLDHTHTDVAKVSFNQLCSVALGAADYIEIAREFGTILLSDIPMFTRDNANECKRFIYLIDELYEHKVKLICTAAAAPRYLYVEGNNYDEFQRTVSRLIEMQSENYFVKEHIA